MRKKRPPGVFCIENVTFVFLLFIICLGIFVYNKFNQVQQSQNINETNNLMLHND